MEGPVSRTAETARAALVGLMTCVLVVVPLLTGSSTSAATELAAVSLVVLALATTSVVRPALVGALPSLLRGPLVAASAALRVLRTRPTDPTHHPLAPRAPGLV